MKILVAYDGSEPAGHALTRVGQVAKPLDDDVTVISVVPLQASGPRSAGTDHQRRRGGARPGARRGRREAEGARHRGEDDRGGRAPAESIVDEADRGKFELIVVGHRGLHGVARFLMGSTATRVVTHAHCDVWVVR